MRTSIILTVYDRPEITLINTLIGLGKQELTNTEIIVVNDGSNIDYTPIRKTFEGALPIKWLDVDTVKDRPGTYNIDGYNNPAYAMNCGFEAATGETIACMSSDVLLPPAALVTALRRDLTKCVWHPKVVDLDSSMVYLGQERVFPVQFFMVTHRDNWLVPSDTDATGLPFDENYLKGIAFDDNDLAATISLRVGKVIIDTDIVAWHQSHPQKAYSDDLKGWKINKAYTEEKWGGLPFDGGKKDPIEQDIAVAGGCLIIKVKRK